MDRRNLLKILSLLPFVSVKGLYGNTKQDLNLKVVCELFKTIHLEKGIKPEFPLNAIRIHPSEDRNATHYIKYGAVFALNNKDSIILPFYKSQDEIYECLQVLYTAAIDRNIAVYDAEAKVGYISEFLLDSMQEVMSHQSKRRKIDYFLVDIKFKNQAEKLNTKAKFLYGDLEKHKDFLLNELNYCLCRNKKEFIIGIHIETIRERKDHSLVKCHRDGEVAIGSLSNKNLILGNF